MGTKPIFGARWQPLLRKRISPREAAVGLALLGVLALTGGWVAVQGDAYDATERDLPYHLLAERPVKDRLYRVPLKGWVEPGTQTGGQALQVEMGLFPSSVLEGGWSLHGRPKVFKPDTLFEKINGEAEKFLKQGFRELHYVSLRAPEGKDEIAVELFDQGSFAGALGIFSGHRSGGRKVLRHKESLYYRTPVGAVGFNGRYFYRIAGSGETEAVRAKREQLVGALAGLSPDGAAMPFPFRILSGPLSVDPARISYQRSNVFKYDFAGDFWFGQPEAGLPALLFLHRAQSPSAAASLFKKIVAEHGEEFDVILRTETRATMRHPFLKTHFAMAVRGAVVFGVERAAGEKEAEGVMNRMAKVLRDEK